MDSLETLLGFDEFEYLALFLPADLDAADIEQVSDMEGCFRRDRRVRRLSFAHQKRQAPLRAKYRRRGHRDLASLHCATLQGGDEAPRGAGARPGLVRDAR